MSALDEIKARAAAPAAIYETYHSPHEYVTALEASQADVMKLVALVEKIRDDTQEQASQYQASSDRLWGLVAARDPERSSQDAARYSAYAALAMASASSISKTIKEALQ